MASTRLGDAPRIENTGSTSWKPLRSSSGHALDDDDDDEGVLRPQIFTRTRESPSLTSAPPNGDGGPPLQLFSKGSQKLL